jgi:hypothetical protein
MWEEFLFDIQSEKIESDDEIFASAAEKKMIQNVIRITSKASETKRRRIS